jgi:ribosome-associated toxin RatA of RatAB toxin-antitoxin module
LNKSNKIIISFYVFLGVSFFVGTLYVDLEFRELYPDIMNSTKILTIIEPLDVVTIENITPVEKKLIFDTITDVKNYPIILPKNIISVKILEQNDNEIIAEEIISEKGITTKMTVKHTIIPYESHTIEIINGDAKGTKITQTFQEIGLDTKIHTTIDIDVKGILLPMKFLPLANVNHAMNTVMNEFVTYAKGFENNEERLIDNMYREILLRPADSESLQYYAFQLKNGTMTEQEIRNELLNSEENQNILHFSEKKSIDELKSDTTQIINDLYLQILNRPADIQGLEYYGNMIERNKISYTDLEDILINSDEAIMIYLSQNERKLIDDLHFKLFDKHAERKIIEYYLPLLSSKEMTLIDIENELLNQTKSYD